MSMKRCMDSTHSNKTTLDWNAPHRYFSPVYGLRTIHTHTHTQINRVIPYITQQYPLVRLRINVFSVVGVRVFHLKSAWLTYTTLLAPLCVRDLIGHCELPVEQFKKVSVSSHTHMLIHRGLEKQLFKKKNKSTSTPSPPCVTKAFCFTSRATLLLYDELKWIINGSIHFLCERVWPFRTASSASNSLLFTEKSLLCFLACVCTNLHQIKDELNRNEKCWCGDQMRASQ